MDAIQKEGYLVGVFCLSISLLGALFLIGWPGFLSLHSGQVIAIYAGIFGVAAIGSFIWPSIIGQFVLIVFAFAQGIFRQ